MKLRSDRINHKGTVIIDTDRLTLRRFKPEDATVMFNTWANDPEVTRYLSWRPHGNIKYTNDILRVWLSSYKKNDFYLWAIELKKLNKIVGSISVENINEKFFRCDVGYCLAKEYWNQGLMTEVLKSILNFLILSIGFKRVQAIHHTQNHASGKVMLKAGMKFEGVIRKFLLDNQEKLIDCKIYAITEGDLLRKGIEKEVS